MIVMIARYIRVKNKQAFKSVCIIVVASLILKYSLITKKESFNRLTDSFVSCSSGGYI